MRFPLISLCILFLLPVALCFFQSLFPQTSGSREGLQYHFSPIRLYAQVKKESTNENSGKQSNFQFVVKRKVSTKAAPKKEQGKQSRYKAVIYQEPKKNIANIALEGPLMRLFQICFNPVWFLAAMYCTTIAWSQVLWLQKILQLFGRGTLSKKDGQEETPADAAFQVFECEKCGLQLRPAKGRASAIFSRERFSCTRCGSKASAYFNIDDMNDPRAVARLARLEEEKKRDQVDETDVIDES